MTRCVTGLSEEPREACRTQLGASFHRVVSQIGILMAVPRPKWSPHLATARVSTLDWPQAVETWVDTGNF